MDKPARRNLAGIPVAHVIDNAKVAQREVRGRWVPARAATIWNATFRGRLRGAWAVLRGNADAVVWPEQEVVDD